MGNVELSIGANVDDMTDVPGDTGTRKRTAIGGQVLEHRGAVTALTFSADGSLVASSSEDHTVFIWDVLGRAAPMQLKGQKITAYILAFSRDNSVLASASTDRLLIILWDVSTGKERSQIVPHTIVRSLVYTPDGMRLLASLCDGKLHVWSSATYDLEKTIRNHGIGFILFSQDGRHMATGGSVCAIWETVQLAAENPEPLSVLREEYAMTRIVAAAFSTDGNRVVTASHESIRIWKTETGEALVILHEHTGPVWSIALFPDRRRVAHGSHSCVQLVFSPDGRWIACAASDHTVHLWKASDRVSTTASNQLWDRSTSVIYSPGGHILVSVLEKPYASLSLRPLLAYVEA